MGHQTFLADAGTTDINSFGNAGWHAGGMLGDSENSFNVSNLMKSCIVRGIITSKTGSAHKLYGHNKRGKAFSCGKNTCRICLYIV